MDSEENSPQHKMSLAMIEMLENFTPMLEVAEGFKATMEARGWGSEAAESAASTMLNGLIRTVMAASGEKST